MLRDSSQPYLKSVLKKKLIVDRCIIDMYILEDFKTKQQNGNVASVRFKKSKF